MKTRQPSLPLLASIAATRGLLGVGIGLLASRRLPRGRRRVIGLALVGVGVLSTVPLAMRVFARH